jgi:hypothetical protein
MALNLDQLNTDIQNWGHSTADKMKAAGASMGIHHSEGSPSPKPSLQQIVARFKYASGLVHIVSFRVPRVLFYTHKGAGRGMGGHTGSSWADKYGNQHRTDPKSLGKAGTGSRKEKPFINDTLQSPDGLDSLGDIVITKIGDAFINNLLIK